MLGGEEEYSPSSAECFTSFNSISKKKRNKNKRRFSDEQIKSLENIFESESKLEPRKKLQLARELGLQPRQVAIWFQNKRARWKSKQLERDYSILLANYNSLASQFENLKKEKQSLVIQLQKLNDLMEKSGEESQCCRQAVSINSIDGQSENGDNSKAKSELACELEEKPRPSSDRSEDRVGILSDDDSSTKAEYFGLEEEPELITMVEAADGCLTSPENWGSLDSNGLLDQLNSNNQWWDFWS